MKWLMLFVLLVALAPLGCSPASSGGGEEAAPPPSEEIDEAAEAEATGMGAEESSSAEE